MDPRPPSMRRVVGLFVVAVAAAAALAEGPSHERELRRLREEIADLEQELGDLAGREAGLAGELARVDAELRLRQKEHDALTLRRDEIGAEAVRQDERILDLEQAQAARRGYLAFRMRELYKSGVGHDLRRFLGDEEIRDAWSGVRYAALLSERDRDAIRAWREDQQRLATERQELARVQGELTAAETAVGAARQELGRARARHAAALSQVRLDQRVRREAIAELESGAAERERLLAGLVPAEAILPLDVRKFRGLLDWPAAGQLRSGFGTVVHPQFKTEVPHPGWDIAAEFGADIRSVFDGTVVFADWMRGYGLTVIVDHASGLMSIYAHASVLTVRTAESVLRGQLLGKVGETASLRGPVLYFELRDGGRAVDPALWLRPR